MNSPPYPSRLQPGLVRLLQLNEGYHGVLTASLKNLRLDDAPYDALSYRWGSEQQQCEIRLAFDNDKPIRFLVTRNLARILRHFQKEGKQNLLWVDAICINQQDNEEKSTQVKHMTEIYSRAETVISWVDEEEGDVDTEIRCVQEVVSLLKMHGLSLVHPERLSGFSIRYKRELRPICGTTNSCEGAFWRFLRRIASAEYFKRQWIVQEICSGSTRTVAYVGGKPITMVDVYNAFSMVELASSNSEQLKSHANICLSQIAHLDKARFGEIMQAYYRSCERLEVHFHDFLPLSRRMSCKLPIDRIFSVLSLDVNKEEILCNTRWPDYNLNEVGIYVKTASLMLTALSDPFETLVHVNEAIRSTQLPSWVPDWSLPYHQSQYHAKLRLHPKIDASGVGSGSQSWTRVIGHQLIVRGLLISRDLSVIGPVADCDGCDDCDQTACPRAIFQTTREWKHGLEMILGHESDQAEFMTTILAQHNFPSTRNKVSDGEEYVRFAAIFRNFAWKRRFGIVAKKHIALLPPRTEDGDVLCMFLGSRVLYILRPAEQGRWNYVGWAYVHAFMDGQCWHLRQPRMAASTQKFNKYFLTFGGMGHLWLRDFVIG